MVFIMAIRVVKFSNGGYKIRKNFASESTYIHTQRKLFNFENWVNGEVLKIGHYFRKQSDLKIDVIKKGVFSKPSGNYILGPNLFELETSNFGYLLIYQFC